MSHIVLFGTGDRGKKLYKLFSNYGIEIEYWIDSDKEKHNTMLEGKPIYSPEKVRNEKDIIVCISAVDEKMEMYSKLLYYGVPKYRIRKFTEAVLDCISHCVSWTVPDKEDGSQSIILDCSNGLALGGVEAWSINLLHELLKKGKEIYLLSPKGEYDVENEVKSRIIWVDSNPQKLFSRKNIEQMLIVLRQQLPCVLIASCVNDVLLAACSLKKKYRKDIKIIAVIHQGISLVYKEYSELSKYIEKYVAVSEEIRQGMIDYGIETEKILHMTCPTECAEPYIRTYSFYAEEPIKIGYAGRIESAQKRMDCLREVLLELERLGTNYRVEVAGTGSYLEELKKEIKELRLEHRVKIVGQMARRDMVKFWTEKDICINLSDFEGRSISIMEAMKNGAVPIVTDTSGIREDIKDGFNGYIVPIGSYKSIAEKIDYLSNNRRLLPLYGDRAHEIMNQKSSMKVHMEFWDKVFQEMEKS